MSPKYRYPLIIFFIVLTISLINYQPGTFLSGWDTLHPEFDFSLNFKRLILGVWREEQGLGAIAGHSHMADLPRVFLLWLFHFIFPLNTLRYLYVFLSLLFGALGLYFLIAYLFKNNRQKELIAFLAALFYLFNLSTVQQFFVPFEMFITQYAFLPWIIFFSIKVLNFPNKKNLLLFSLITLFSTPQAYAAHLWYPFFGCFLLFLFFYSVFLRKSFKRSSIIVLLTLTINSFWLLPNLYFIKTSSQIPQLAKQNRIFSQEYRLRNRENGYLKDVALNKGFYFNWSIYDFEKEKFVYLMQTWRTHLEKKWIKIIGYLGFSFAVLGILLSFLKKNKVFLSFLPFFVIPFVFLMNHTFPFDSFFDFLSKIPLFNEALRFVFTKFSLLLQFAYTLYFAFTTNFVLKKMKNKFFQLGFAAILSFLLIIYALPVFQKDLISQKVRIKIPNEYFDFWSFMKEQPDGKVLSLPLYNFAGWQYYRWGYQGSGFIWFGLKQPILDRDFDRWSSSNEQTFKEFHYALYSQNPQFFIEALQKFDISYIFWDKNIIAPDFKNKQQKVYTKEIESILSFLEQEKKIKKIYKQKNLSVYRVNFKQNPVRLSPINTFIYPRYLWNFFDPAFKKFQIYLTHPQAEKNNVFYPLRSLLTANERLDQKLIEFSPKENSFFIKIPKTAIDFKNVFIPELSAVEDVIFANLFIQKIDSNRLVLLFEGLLPKDLEFTASYQFNIKNEKSSEINFTFNGKQFTIDKRFCCEDKLYLGQVFIYLKEPNYLDGEKIFLKFLTKKSPSLATSFFLKFPLSYLYFPAEEIYNQNKENRQLFFLENREKNKVIKLKSKDKRIGVYINFGNLPHQSGYLLVINHKNISGLPLRICLHNWYSKLCSLYDELAKNKEFQEEYFVIPPSDFNLGYSLSFDNISFGNYISENEIKYIYLIPFPYHFLTNIYFYNKPSLSPTNLFYLSFQSFHPGWKLYQIQNSKFKVQNWINTYLPFLFGKEIKEHVIVNNWANGWIISPNIKRLTSNINNLQKETFDVRSLKFVVIFWPQYLEFIGFGLLVVGFLLIVFYKPQTNNQ